MPQEACRTVTTSDLSITFGSAHVRLSADSGNRLRSGAPPTTPDAETTCVQLKTNPTRADDVFRGREETPTIYLNESIQKFVCRLEFRFFPSSSPRPYFLRATHPPSGVRRPRSRYLPPRPGGCVNLNLPHRDRDSTSTVLEYGIKSHSRPFSGGLGQPLDPLGLYRAPEGPFLTLRRSPVVCIRVLS